MEESTILRFHKTVFFLLLLLTGICLIPFPAQSQSYAQPPTDFGSKNSNPSFESINWAEFWNLFNSHSIWNLEYDEGSGWIACKQNLQIIKNYIDPTKCKITLEFTASQPSIRADYQLTFAIDLDIKNYTYKQSLSRYTLKYQDYTVFFDFSDLKQISGLNFDHGIKSVGQEKYWWFRAKRNNVPQGAFLSLDPSFGYELEGGYALTLKDQIRGSYFYCDGGWAESITAYLYVSTTGKFRCAIYKLIGNIFVAQTQERTLSSGGLASWYTFNFTEPLPTLQSGFYTLLMWAENTSYCYAETIGEYIGRNKTETYTGEYPETLSLATNDYKHSIYCTYLKSGGWQGEPEPEPEPAPLGGENGGWEENETVIEIGIPDVVEIEITQIGLYIILASVAFVAIVGMGKAVSSPPKRIRPKGTSRSTRKAFSKRRSRYRTPPKRSKFRKTGPRGKT